MRNLESNKSQLSVIFDVIGTPSEQDLSCVDQITANLLLRLVPKQPKASCCYVDTTLFPHDGYIHFRTSSVCFRPQAATAWNY